MKKILVIDRRRDLSVDFQMQLIVENAEDRYQIDAYNPENAKDLASHIGGKMYDFVLIEHEMLNRVKPGDFGTVPIYGYATNKEKPEMFDTYKIPFMGIANTSEEIIHKIDSISAGKTPDVPEAKEPDTSSVTETTPVEITQEEPKKEQEPATQVVTAAEPAAKLPQEPKPVQKEPEKKIQKEEKVELKGNRLREMQVHRVERELEREYEVPVQEEKKTRTIAVWSAKGGVGKTTTACNLALYLSMMEHGRGKYKVCLVDYNIESGDVRTILGFKGDKIVDMGIWAEDIHQMIVRGMKPENITFTNNQIFQYLEKYHDKTGLYVLLAPELHENAQFIEAGEIQVMLDNIINNGDFDFVICDTADNTSDSSYYALEKADTAILICTQDVATANRNDSVIRSLKRSGLDTSKFKLVVNNVASRRKTGVSVPEVESYFEEYESIGRIHENDDVPHANNFAKPLVLKPKNTFTEDMRGIVQWILKENPTDERKGGIFSKMFNK